MPKAFKDNFNLYIIEKAANILHRRHNAFNKFEFIQDASKNLSQLELKQRSNQIKDALDKHMPEDFDLCSQIVLDVLAPASLNENIQFGDAPEGLAGWVMMPICDFVTLRALQKRAVFLDKGLALLKECTKRFSAEFAIRPFLQEYPEQTLVILSKWAVDANVHVRRLVSEGCRPYLPWGLRLNSFAKSPDLILPLLTLLKDDESEYVRRSVANNLNDIAKEKPDWVANLAASWWQEENVTRTRLITHACRTLIKNGHPVVLQLMGYAPAKISQVNCQVLHQQVPIGEKLCWVLTLKNQLNSPQDLLVDYVIYYQKANGNLSPKVFKWTKIQLLAKSELQLEKQHSFKPVTTRKYHLGLHKVAVLINGKEFCSDEFQLVESNQQTLMVK